MSCRLGGVYGVKSPRRYTIVVADRQTGAVRRLTIRLRPFAAGVVVALFLPIFIGMWARQRALVDVDALSSTNLILEEENASYRAATGALTTQIESLQSAINELGIRANMDPVSAAALDKLPANVRNRAEGGTSVASASAMSTPKVFSPENTFSILRDVLKSLERHLSIVKRDVERRESLMNATPSIWPVHGWLSAGYGRRRDPFTGQPDFHPGLDISAERGTPIHATAAGTVEFAAHNGDYGNLIVLNHGYGLVTRYGHLSRFVARLGQKVKRGDVVGYVGATGRATGAHLHYEVLANGKLVNPLQLLVGKVSERNSASN